MQISRYGKWLHYEQKYPEKWENHKKWILDTDGYIPIGDDFRYKAQTVEISVKDTNGNVRKLKQKLVCYWSRRFYKREAAEHQSFLAFIEKLKTSPERFRVTKTQVQSIHRFIRKEIINTEMEKY